MWNLFRRKRAPDTPIDLYPLAIRADEWVRMKLPDPGAQNFSYVTYELPPYTVIGAGVAVRQPKGPFQPGSQPYFPTQHTSLQGIGQVSGSIKSQPLFNPRFNAYSGARPLTMNDPAPRAEIIPAGSATQ